MLRISKTIRRLIIFIVIIITILNLSGCKSQTNKDDVKFSKEIDAQLANTAEAFINRTMHNELTEKIIDSTSDQNLLQLVFDNLYEKLPKGFEKEYEIVMSWNKSKQAIYMIWALEAEVNNGGYNQFFYNSSGQFYEHLPEALKLVGANNFADLTKRANETFEKENPKITQDQDGTFKGFSKSYDENPLNKFDEEFYELYKTENLQQIQVDYIRKNKIDFID